MHSLKPAPALINFAVGYASQCSRSLFATPIINQPQAGILGIGKIEKRVKVIDDAIAIRPLAFASFTFDHRILDGATADAFISTIKEIIEDWQ